MKTKKATSIHLTNSAQRNRRINPSRTGGLIRKPFLLKILAVALMGASLALFLCAVGAVSYGDSAGLKPLNVTVDTQFYPTVGNPADALVTADESYVLVSVSGVSPPGVQVFSKPDFTNPCGGQAIINFPPLRPPAGLVQSVYGMKFFPGPLQVSVGAAVEAQGAEFFRLASLNQPCAIDGIVNVQQPPVNPYCPGAPLCPPGSFDVEVTPDGQYAFVANEYGTMPSPTPPTLKGGGTIGVIVVERDAVGRFTPGTRSIPVNNIIHIPGGPTIPGITMSHDGRYLYVTCEGSAEGYYPPPKNHIRYRDPTNIARSPNGEVLCPGCSTGHNFCDNEAKGTLTRNGLLAVIDVDKAIHGAGQDSIKTIIASGCSPVRAVETADGQYLWVAARGKNKQLPHQPGTSGYHVLAFHIPTLVSPFPNLAFVGYGDSGGTAPVGMALFGNNDSMLAVANSNRFYNHRQCVHPPQGEPPCTASVAILDVSNPGAPTIEHIIPNEHDAFPRDVTVGPDGSTLYVPNYNARRLEVITTSVK